MDSQNELFNMRLDNDPLSLYDYITIKRGIRYVNLQILSDKLSAPKKKKAVMFTNSTIFE